MNPAFLDTNIPLYAVGSPHPLKEPCAAVLALASEWPSSFITDAEVLQELLHRYVSRRRLTQGKQVFSLFSELMTGRIEGIWAEDVQRAASMTEVYPRLQARDLIHLAVAQRLNAPYIVSADKAFDGVVGVERLDPMDVDAWREKITDLV